MGIKHTIEMVLKMQNEASKELSKFENQMKKASSSSKGAFNQVNQSLELNSKNVNKLASQMQRFTQTSTNGVNKVAKGINTIGTEGATSFRELSKSEQDALIKFNMLDKETRNLITNMNNIKLMPGMVGAIEQAKSKFHDLSNVTQTWSGSMDYAKSKLQLLGADTESLRGKIQVTGTAIQTYLGTKWDGIKTKVQNSATVIKTALGGALTTVKNKVTDLGNKFSGLGGIISSAIGAVGMASITELTVGLSMNRERMTALTNATMGGAKAGDQLLNGFTGVNEVFKDLSGNSTKTFMGLDEMTNHSLVGLDDLGQAMSTIKMSTGMTNEELMMFSTTVNDVGQRAILMGKSGEEAISLMQAAGRGLNGEFDMLKTNFGITKDTLTDLGWSGAADDIEGYQAALDKALAKGGSMDDMLNTTTGHLESLKKNFRVAGRHVGDIFTPYIDQAVQKLNELNDTCPHLFESLVGVAGAASAFATLAPSIAPVVSTLESVGKYAKASAVFLGILEGEEGALTAATWMQTAAQKINNITHAEGAIAAAEEAVANGGLTASFSALAASVWAAMAPLLPFIAAAAAVAIAVYELGKYFGWWTDVGSMIDAVTAGIQRLWAAFVNNPDVQSFLAALGAAWNGLVNAITPVIGAVLEFFNVSQGGEFDIVRAIIDTLGAAFHHVADSVRTVVSVLQTIYGIAITIGQGIYNALKPIVCILLGCSPGIVPALERVREAFTTVWGFISGIVSTVVAGVVAVLSTVVQIALAIFTHINMLMTIFQAFATGQISLQQTLTLVWNLIVSTLTNIFGIIMNNVVAFAANFVSNALRAGRQFVTNIITFIKTLPSKVLSYLKKVASHMVAQGSAWVRTAKTKASSLVTGVINYLIGLPGKAYSQLTKVVGKIVSAGGAWVSNAKTQAGKIVSGIKDKLTGAPGAVYDKLKGIKEKIASALGAALEKAKEYAGKIKQAVSEAGNSANAYGGYDLAYGGLDLVSNPTTRNINNYVSSSSEDINVNLKKTLDINLDLKNVPPGMDKDMLKDALNETVNSREFIESIVKNNDFQVLDQKIKSRINAKNIRARGL